MAKVFSDFADELEGAEDIELAARNLIRSVMKHHSKVIYGGDNYSEGWADEARRRGLVVASNPVEAIHHMADEAFVELCDELDVLSPAETISRHDIKLENYCLVLNVEAQTALDMFRRLIRPAVYRSLGDLARDLTALEQLGVEQKSGKMLLQSISDLVSRLEKTATELEEALKVAKQIPTLLERAEAFYEIGQNELEDLRVVVDRLENLVPAKLWPMPSYRELLVQE